MFKLVSEEIDKIKLYYRETFICLGIFIIAVYAGYIAAVLVDAGSAEQYFNTVRNTLFGKQLPENVFMFILTRNALVSFLVLVAGIFTYSVWPVLVLLINGAVSGFIVKLQAMIFYRFSFEIWLFGLLPHGVPELSALFLAAGATFYYRRLRKSGQFNWSGVMRTYLLVVLPLLVLAALIETFITPVLISRFLA